MASLITTRGSSAGGLRQLLQLGLLRLELLDGLRRLADVVLAIAELEPADLGRDLARGVEDLDGLRARRIGQLADEPRHLRALLGLAPQAVEEDREILRRGLLLARDPRDARTTPSDFFHRRSDAVMPSPRHASRISVSFQHESLNNILRMAPPGTERGGWTSTILYVLGDGGVFDGWERFLTNDGGELSNRKRDGHMIDACRTDGLVLITRDTQVIEEARAVGVNVHEPEAFAARYMTRDAARRACEERIATATFRYLTRGPVGEHEPRMRAGHRIRELYGEIWRPTD